MLFILLPNESLFGWTLRTLIRAVQMCLNHLLLNFTVTRRKKKLSLSTAGCPSDRAPRLSMQVHVRFLYGTF